MGRQADIVQQRRTLEPALPLDAKSQLLGNHVGKQRDPVAVAACERTFSINDLGKAGGDLVEIILVDLIRFERLWPRCHGIVSITTSSSVRSGRGWGPATALKKVYGGTFRHHATKFLGVPVRQANAPI